MTLQSRSSYFCAFLALESLLIMLLLVTFEAETMTCGPISLFTCYDDKKPGIVTIVIMPPHLCSSRTDYNDIEHIIKALVKLCGRWPWVSADTDHWP